MLNDINGTGQARARRENGAEQPEPEGAAAPRPALPPPQEQAEGWLSWGVGLVIRSVRNVILHPFRALTVGLAASTALMGANMLLNGSGTTGSSGLSRRSAGPHAQSPEPWNQTATNATSPFAPNNTSSTIAVEMNLRAILAAAGHLNTTNSTVDTSISFLDQTCEDGVLRDIFDEGHGDNHTAAALNNATIWRSRHAPQPIRQLNLNQDQFEVALGSALSNEGGCITGFSVEPGSFLPPANNTQQQLEREAIDDLADGDVECLPMHGHSLRGEDGQGKTSAQMTLNFCQRKEGKVSQDEHRARRAADPDPLAEEGAVGGANATASNATGAEGDPAALMAEIEQIRATFCSPNITIASNSNATTAAPLPFSLLLEQITRLCPATEIFEANIANLNGLFSASAWAQFFDNYLSDITSATVIALDVSISSNLTDVSSLTQLVQLLVERGVTVFTATNYSPLANVPRMRSRRTTAQILASGSDFIRLAENPPDPTRTHTAIIVGVGLILLIPAMVYGNNWRRRRRQAQEDSRSTSSEPLPRDGRDQRAPPNRSASYDALPQEEIELDEIDQPEAASRSTSCGSLSQAEAMSLGARSSVASSDRRSNASEGSGSAASLASENQSLLSAASQASLAMTMEERSSLLSGTQDDGGLDDGLAPLPHAASLSALNFSVPRDSLTRASSRSLNLATGAYTADDPCLSLSLPVIPQYGAAEVRAPAELTMSLPFLDDDHEEETLQTQADRRAACRVTCIFKDEKQDRSLTDIYVDSTENILDYKDDPENETRLEELRRRLEEINKKKNK
ncbi:MAG: hypothetical protein ACRCWB_08060 [Enterovibrio sp.]